ncbi:MAG: GFA family protein [Alphaproteobacteria bacterium]|nr:GFA family protein [Alphaproteobacteria bacterium]
MSPRPAKAFEPLSGGCLCRAVRFVLSAPPDYISNCHCSMCRRQSGSACLPFATVPRAALRWMRGRPRWYRSSAKARRGFCGRCGSTLAYDLPGGRGPQIDLAVGAFDRAERLAPQWHVYYPDKLAWVAADRLPRHVRGSRSPLMR